MSEVRKATLDIGMLLDDKWVILEFIGKGGMGEVYRAHQLNLKRDVAIKIISQEWLQSFDCDPEEAEGSLERFHREVQVMAQMHHPNILQIFDQGSTTVRRGETDLAIEYIVMEYVPGSTLRTTMSEEGFYPEEDRTQEWLQDYFLPLLDGVRVLHEQGIAHRDLKPENVLLAGNTPKIADFGLARSCFVKPITRSAHVMGTPPYMAQEQFLDFRRTDHRADIYSLGKILFEALAGKMGSDQIPFKQARLKDPQGSFFQKLDRIIRHATREDRKDRLSSVEELSESIRKLLMKGEEPPAPGQKVTGPKAEAGRPGASRFVKWLAACAVVLIVVVVALVSFHEGEKEGPGMSPQQPSIGESRSPTAPGESVRPETRQSTLAASIKGKDDAMLNLVPGGEISLPEKFETGGAKTVRVASFYMDTTPVTNVQYVDFLNRVLPKIRVQNGVVEGDGKIWLMLGEVKPGYEPIEFRGGEFHIKAAPHAACPVLRITGYGALAYARYYNERLPTDIEWYYALKTGRAPKESGAAAEESQKKLPIPSPVMLYTPNALGIRGLNANIGEWGTVPVEQASGEKAQTNTYVILGGALGERLKETPIAAPLSRYPWEAFEKVGFRCVRDAPE